MQLTILALGSQGDVQPFVALGAVLAERGHAVRVATASDYQPLVEEAGLDFAPIVGEIRQIMDFDLVYEALDAARNPLPLGFAQRFLEHVNPLVVQIVRDCFAAAQGAHAVLASTLGMLPGSSIAERLGLPLVPAHFHPFAPTSAFPDMSFVPLPTWMPGQRAYNLLSHHLSAQGLWQLLRPALNRARRVVLGLPALSVADVARRAATRRPLVLYGYSPTLAPPPADWHSRHTVTGPWLLPADTGAWQPSAELAAFLEAGPPPVYVGFGSILVGREPQQVTQLVLDALAQAGQRGLLFRGWGDFGTGLLPENVRAIDAVPHRWLFPRTRAVVTHGGAGTVTAALCAGVPPVVVPFFGDQRFWGQQVAHAQAGPPPIPRAYLNAENLAAAIRRACSESAMRQQAGALGRRIAAEQGAQRAAQALIQGLGW